MTTYLIWAIIGFVLVIAELVTGTLYLLVIGVAALAAALVAFLGGDFWLQAITAAVVTLLGVYGVHTWWQKRPRQTKESNNLDFGQHVVLESWTNQAAGSARVKYRGASWDARVTGSANLNDTLVIEGQRNGVLDVRPLSG